MVNLQKKTQVQALVDTLQKNSNFILIKFEKTTHQALETLRRDLKKKQAAIKVIKNTLLEKAINKLAISEKLFAQYKKKFLPLKENSAILMFKNDWNDGLSTFYQFIQKEKTLGFKSGIIEREIYDEIQMARIAGLPGRNQLMANIIGSLKSPMTHLTYALKYNVNKLVYILQQKSKEVKN